MKGFRRVARHQGFSRVPESIGLPLDSRSTTTGVWETDLDSQTSVCLCYISPEDGGPKGSRNITVRETWHPSRYTCSIPWYHPLDLIALYMYLLSRRRLSVLRLGNRTTKYEW